MFMASEGRAGVQETARHTQVRYSASGGANKRSVTLGLVPAPDIPEKIAYDLADQLPELLGKHIDDRVDWDVSIVCDPLTGAEQEAPDILDRTHELMQQEGWDYAICLTDLPVLRGRQVIVADADETRGVGGISLPPLGVTLLRRRTLEAMLQLVSEMHQGTSDSDRDREGQRQDTGAPGESYEEGRLRGGGARQLIGHRLTERLSPIKRVTPSDEDMDVDVRFVAPRASGRLRLLAGMVYANGPLGLFTIMKTALAAAFATGAFVLVTPTIWQLGYAGGLVRMFVLMLVSLVAMVVWFIVSHGLWERPSEAGSRYLAGLYNAATTLTLSVAVLFSYAMLYVLILLAALVFIEPGFFQSSIQSVAGRPIGLGDYLILAWMTASLAVVAGAIGSGLEDEETVLRATYGYRQRRRSEESEEESAAERRRIG
jgi:hypothetical protein